MYFDYSKKPRAHKSYYLGKATAKLLSKFVYRKVTVKGKENIPESGSLIIACNHIAFSDPAVIVANCTRTVYFMAKSELFENPFYAAFMRNMNAFPVRRNHSDRDALRFAKAIINNGWVLGIFPEGKRVRDSSPTEGKNGTAFLARITGADVLPACIFRAEDDKGRWHSLTLIYGDVIKNEELFPLGEGRNDSLDKASLLIMNKIKELWEEENENHCR